MTPKEGKDSSPLLEKNEELKNEKRRLWGTLERELLTVQRMKPFGLGQYKLPTPAQL